MTEKKQILICSIGLVCIILGRVGAEPNTPESQESKAERLTAQLVDLGQKPVSKVRQELENTIDALAAIGDPAIPVLMNYFNAENQESSVQHLIVSVFVKICSDNAQKNLKEIALSKRKDVYMRRWAASHFIGLIREKKEAIPLLDSNEVDVQNLALVAIRGIELDADLVSKVGAFLTNDDRQTIRWAAAHVYEVDPSQNFYRQKIDFILRAVDKVYTYTDANKVPFRTYYTFAQMDLQNYINALSNMNGPLSSLQQIHRETLTELAGDVLLIARAMRNDKAVKSEIISIIKNRKEMILRLQAVDSMKKIGSAEDIEFLQSVANTDPYCYESLATPLREMCYPIRETAKGVIQKINKN